MLFSNSTISVFGTVNGNTILKLSFYLYKFCYYFQIEGLLDDEDFKLKVTRAELEHLSEDMFDRVTKPIEDALKASEITTVSFG